ncbi:MAG: LuxR C-terminal-related transcriptional regulator [Thermodesulfobacteriota bacterium]
MDSYSDIIKKRALAGVMILNASKDLIYVNDEAKAILFSLIKANDSGNPGSDGSLARLPEEILTICDDLTKHMDAEQDAEQDEQNHFVYKNIVRNEEDYFLRAIPIHRISGVEEVSHIMVTIEKFSTRLTADIKKVGRRFELTKRETQVLKGVARGMSNKDVSRILFISEHTVKDHVRNIMHKMGVNNRSLLLCRIFESNQ